MSDDHGPETLTFSSDASKEAYERALGDRHGGRYVDAIDALEQVIQTEGDSAVLWGELAVAYFMWWQALVKAMHTPDVIDISNKAAAMLARKSGNRQASTDAPTVSVCLQHTYNTFLIAMEFPSNKKNPALLLQLTRLYMEFAAFRGALSVCTLLIEGYSATFDRLNEAVFLAAVTALALAKHHESAQYFQYIVDKPPRGVFAYQLHLLSATELAKVKHVSELALKMEKDAYAQAYHALMKLSPASPSEKAAHEEYRTSRRSEAQRIERWRLDPRTWIDLAKRMAAFDAPVLVVEAVERARRHLGGVIRMGADQQHTQQSHQVILSVDVLLLEACALFRTGRLDAAVAGIENVLYAPHAEDDQRPNYYSSKLGRFLLGSWSPAWRARFELECASVKRIRSWLRRCQLHSQWIGTSELLIVRHRNQRATVIQCALRCFAARRQRELLRIERREREATENVTMGKEDLLLILKELNAAARKIQGLHAIASAKKERDMRCRLREHHNSLIATFGGRRMELQQAHVFANWRKFVTLARRERQKAASTIQRCVRVFLTRRMYKRLLDRKRRQDQLVLSFLDTKHVSLRRKLLFVWREFTKEMQIESEQATTAIQRRYRVRLARRKFLADMRRHQIALGIMRNIVFSREQRRLQASWKALATHALHQRLEKGASAVRIQSRARGMLARAHVWRLRARQQKIKRAVKAMQARSRVEMLRLVIDALQQNVEMNWQEREQCATDIQRVFRGHRARKRVGLLRECKRLLALAESTGDGLSLKTRSLEFVLRLCFLVLARLPRDNENEHLHGRLRLQRWWRSRLKRKKLQESLRKRIGRRKLLLRYELNARSAAALFFCELRALVDAKRWRRHYAAQRIQRAIRRWLAVRRYERVIERHAASRNRAEQYAMARYQRQMRVIMDQWKTLVMEHRWERDGAVRSIQRAFRTRRAKRIAGNVVAKKAAQARMLTEAAHQTPLERCFRKWEAMMLEKAVLTIRSTTNRSTTPCSSHLSKLLVLDESDQRSLGWVQGKGNQGKPSSRAGGNSKGNNNNKSKDKDKRTLEQRAAEVPNVLFYTMLNRVRQTGILQLAFSGGMTFRDVHMRQLVSLASCVISDAGVADPSAISLSFLPNQNELVINAIAGVSDCPVQKLMLHNSRLDVDHITTLGAALRVPNSRLTALVLSNVPLGTAAAVALADAVTGGSLRLEQLVLERCAIGNPGAVAIAEALHHARTLWKLDLTGNRLSDSACPAIAALLLASDALQLLGLGGNALSDRGVLGHLAPALQALADARGALSRLEQIDLRGNSPGVSRRAASDLLARLASSISSSNTPIGSASTSSDVRGCADSSTSMSSSSSSSSTPGGIRAALPSRRAPRSRDVQLQIVL